MPVWRRVYCKRNEVKFKKVEHCPTFWVGVITMNYLGFSKFCTTFVAEMRVYLTSAGVLLFRYSLVFILSDSHCPKFTMSANSNSPSFIQCAIFEVVRGWILRMLFTTIIPCLLLVSIATTKFLLPCVNFVRMTLLPICVALRNTAIGFCIASGKSRISCKWKGWFSWFDLCNKRLAAISIGRSGRPALNSIAPGIPSWYICPAGSVPAICRAS